jgi:hypothetical protein
MSKYFWVISLMSLFLSGCNSDDNYSGFWKNSAKEDITLEITNNSNGAYTVAFTNNYSAQREGNKFVASLNNNNILEMPFQLSTAMLSYNDKSKILVAPALTRLSSDFVKVTDPVEIAKIKEIQKKAKNKKITQFQITQIESSVERFYLMKGRYPTSEEGLNILLTEEMINKNSESVLANFTYSFEKGSYKIVPNK